MQAVRLFHPALVVVLGALLSGTASADSGLPPELDPRIACPPNADPANLNRMAQIRMEVLALVNYRDTERERAIRMGGITPQLEYQIAQLMQRRQALEFELADRQAWAARELAKCRASVRAARVQRIGAVPIESLRQIPPDQRLEEERAAIIQADKTEAAEQATRAETERERAASDKSDREQAQDMSTLSAADPKLIRLILSTHFCYYKSSLAHSTRVNNFALYKGQLDGEIEDYKERVACAAKKFKEYEVTPIDCANKRMQPLTHCLPSIYEHADTIIVNDSDTCLPEGDALVELDRLMMRRHLLDKCAPESDGVASASGEASSNPLDPAALTPQRARKLGLSETRVALSARRCNFIYKLQALAKKPDPESVPPATARALLDMANRQLAQANLKPIACSDRMVTFALPCLPSIHGELRTPLWCTNDVFTRFMMATDRAIPLGVKIPWKADTAEGRLEAELNRMGIEAELKSSLSGGSNELHVTILKDASNRPSKVISDILINLFKADLAKANYGSLTVSLKGEHGQSFHYVQ